MTVATKAGASQWMAVEADGLAVEAWAARAQASAKAGSGAAAAARARRPVQRRRMVGMSFLSFGFGVSALAALQKQGPFPPLRKLDGRLKAALPVRARAAAAKPRHPCPGRGEAPAKPRDSRLVDNPVAGSL